MKIKKINDFINENQNTNNLREKLVNSEFTPIQESDIIYDDFLDINVEVSYFEALVGGYAIKYNNGKNYLHFERICELNPNMAFFTWGPGSSAIIGYIFIKSENILRTFTIE